MPWCFRLKPYLGSCRELAFGQTVYTIVFDDIDHWCIAAHGMFELSHADAGRVAVTGKPDTTQAGIAKQRAGCHGRHTSMQAIETEGTIQEICGTLARAANAAEFDHIFRNDVGFIAGSDDLVGNRVVSAALAQRAGVATIIRFFKAGQVEFYVCAGHREWFSH